MRLLPMLALTLAMLLWGSSFIALKHVLGVWEFGQVLFMRMLVAGLCWLLLWRHLWRFTYQAGDWRWLALLGTLEPCLYFLLEVNALRYTSAGQAGMVCALLPLLVAMVAYLLLGERISRRQLLGCMIAIIGVVALSLGGEQEASAPNPLLGNALEMLAMLCAATYSVVLKKLSSRYGVLPLTALQAFVGILFFAPFAFSSPWPTGWRPFDLAVILFLGAFVTLGAYLLYNWAVTQVKVTLAAAYVNLLPVFTLIFAYLLLGERLTPLQGIACLTVLLGIAVGQMPLRRRKLLPEPG